MNSIRRARRHPGLGHEFPNAFNFKLENGKRYAHTALSNYQILMASLQPNDKRLPNCGCDAINKDKRAPIDEDKVFLIIEHDLKEHILCTLDRKRLHQCKLNLVIQPGEQVAFRTIGRIPIQLSGVSSEAQ